ncbi:MAG TPA: DUF6448 family protein [Thermoanaerobaculia bacterium]
MKVFPSQRFALTALAVLLGLFVPTLAAAHCDTMDGPVVASAKIAFEKGDVTPVLKWVRPEDEKEIRAAFARAMAARAGSKEARELADTWFFEALVRVHRAGEGAPYTGLEPAGTPIEPSITLADQALAAGDPADLIRAVGGKVADGIRERFVKAAEAKKHAEESVAKGRAFVAAYVELTHYVERLHADATSAAAPHVHGESEGTPAHKN